MNLALVLFRVVPDFGSSSGKSGIRPFFENSAKSGSGQISNRIWLLADTVQLQYVQLITEKNNAADLSSGVFAILILCSDDKNTKFIAVTQISSKAGEQ